MNEFLPSFADFYNAIYPFNLILLSLLEVLVFSLLSDIVLMSYMGSAKLNELSETDRYTRITVRFLWLIIFIISIYLPIALVAACVLMIISLFLAIYHHKKSILPLCLLCVSAALFISEIIPGFMPLYDYNSGGMSETFAVSVLNRGLNVEALNIIIVSTGIYTIIRIIKPMLDNGSAMKISHRNFNHICLEHKLTEREIEIAKLVCRGFNNSEISEMLYISVGTVKVHIHHIFEKFEVNTRVQLLARIMTIELDEEQ